MIADDLMDVRDLPYLDMTDPNFSIRSAEVNAAREKSWCARTNYGLAVLRYDEVHKLMRDARLRQGSYAWPKLNGVSGVFAGWWERMLLSQEGANHARLRRLANPAFSPKLVISLRPEFAKLANELIDKFVEKGSCEFMADFAEPYATRVICMLLGLSHEKWRELADLAADMGLALGVTFKQDLDTVDTATTKLFDYVMGLVNELRGQTLGEDFLSMLVRTNLESDEALSEQELYDMIMLAIFGGIDTTRNQLGLAMDVFMNHPDQWALLGDNPELGKSAVEEVMRMRPTITWVTREAVEDFTYQGLEIKRGTTIHLFGQSAASDPRAYPDPSFNITLERKPHFGFGGGAHFCLGHFIARGDMTEALAILAHRMRNPRVDGVARFLPDSGNTGPITLPIAFDRGERKAFIPPSSAAPADGETAASQSGPSLSLTILYGTQTGNAEQMASDIAGIAKTRGFAPRVAPLDSMAMADLARLKRLLIVTSTYGQGEMPDTARGFWEALSSDQAPSLAGLSYSVMAMGDSGYETFCQAGQDIDHRLSALGARPVEARVDCDTNYAATAFAWVDRALGEIRKVEGAEDEVATTAPDTAARSRWNRRNPLMATLSTNRRLSGSGSSKDTRHIEIALGDSGFTYEAGDCIGVIPTNDPALVDAVMNHFGLCAHVPVAGHDRPLGTLLAEQFEIAAPSRELVAEVGRRSGNAELNHVLEHGDRQALDSWLYGRDCLDLLQMVPNGALSAGEFIGLLKPLQHRAYSISSSPKEYPDSLHLTVATIRYPSHGRARKGVASTYLADRVGEGHPAPIFLSPNRAFRVPEDNAAPMIMIGPGTGVAPFRAFLQERRATGASGRNWLFFGERTKAHDFLYGEEFQRMQDDGLLTRMDLAFSRDQAEKIYVQHRMRENGRDLFAWLEEGGYLYVCGDATRMAADVEEALSDILQREGAMSAEAADLYLERLRREKRYLRDVY
jgi:sulfite reductase (NADPH) flavoprotein alpha-component